MDVHGHRTLFVKNLVNPEKEALKEACEVVGKVRRVRMIHEKSGEFKRCAFVEFEDANMVDEAEHILNDLPLMGERIRVERYRSVTPERKSPERRSPSRSPTWKTRMRQGSGILAAACTWRHHGGWGWFSMVLPPGQCLRGHVPPDRGLWLRMDLRQISAI
eukprot:Skav226957  [mRNA]  locus=scaffold51:50627:54361:+ [translate_table: standard]